MDAKNGPATTATPGPWPALVSSGEALAGLNLGEIEGLPGSRDVLGNIEIRRHKGITWLMVWGEEGIAGAAHRALDLYLAEKGGASVRVLRKTDALTVVETGEEWVLAVSFACRKGSGFRPR